MKKNKEAAFDQIVAILDKRMVGSYPEYLVKWKNQEWPVWMEASRLKGANNLIS
jgi:hypothetical protein